MDSIMIGRSIRRNYCPKCKKMIRTFADSHYRKHVANCQGLFRYFCPDCKSWRTLTKWDIIEHMRSHRGLLGIDLELVDKLKPIKKKIVAEKTEGEKL